MIYARISGNYGGNKLIGNSHGPLLANEGLWLLQQLWLQQTLKYFGRPSIEDGEREPIIDLYPEDFPYLPVSEGLHRCNDLMMIVFYGVSPSRKACLEGLWSRGRSRGSRGRSRGQDKKSEVVLMILGV